MTVPLVGCCQAYCCHILYVDAFVKKKMHLSELWDVYILLVMFFFAYVSLLFSIITLAKKYLFSKLGGSGAVVVTV